MPAKKEDKPKKKEEGKGKENKPKKDVAPKKDAAPKPKKDAPKKDAPKKDVKKDASASKKKDAPKKEVTKKAPASKKESGGKKTTASGKKDNKLGVKKDALKKGSKPSAATKKGAKGAVAVGKKGAKEAVATKKGAKPAAPVPKKKKGSHFKALYPVKRRARKTAPIGREQPRKRDLTRYIKWPRYIRVQKQKKILMMRLKVPPTIFQFTRTLDRSNATSVLSFANKYRLETPKQKKRRLLHAAKKKVASPKNTVKAKRPTTVVAGLNAVTRAVEQKKAKLVVIAHDVSPIELVAWLPNLCRRLEVPYVIIKGKSRLGTITHQKTCAVVAFTNVRKEDEAKLKTLADMAKELFNDNADIRKQWGGGTLGPKRLALIAKRQRIIAAEIAQRAGGPK